MAAKVVRVSATLAKVAETCHPHRIGSSWQRPRHRRCRHRHRRRRLHYL